MFRDPQECLKPSLLSASRTSYRVADIHSAHYQFQRMCVVFALKYLQKTFNNMRKTETKQQNISENTICILWTSNQIKSVAGKLGKKCTYIYRRL